MNPVWEVAFTFAPVPPVELDLEAPDGRNEFRALTTSADALRIKDVEINHPGRFFELATFVDTPGLDSTHQHHSALTTDFLQQSDAYLFFLNGKHILNKSDSHTLLEILKLRLNDYLHTEKKQKQAYEMAKFFFIINFADTLTHHEREKTRNFLRKNLSLTLKENGINVPELQIFLISPLQALQGKDTERFNKLLNKIQLGIWNYRGRHYFKNHLKNLRSRIEAFTKPNSTQKSSDENDPQLLLTKFTACTVLKQGVIEIKDEIHARFSTVLDHVDQFKQARQFKNFVWGTPGTQGQLVTHIRNFSYFRWANALNRKIQQYTASLQKKVYRSVDTRLHQCKISINPYSLSPELTGISVSQAIEQMKETISRSRNFYGGFKAKEARFKLSLILKEQERQMCSQLDEWQTQMNRYVKDLITPGVIQAVNNFVKGSEKQLPDGKRLLKTEIQVLNKYLSEIKNIEKILNSPGGT